MKLTAYDMAKDKESFLADHGHIAAKTTLVRVRGVTKEKQKIEPSPKMLDDIKTLSYKQVKAKYNIGYSTITRIRKDHGLLSPNAVWTADIVASMFEMQANGLTIAQIAEKIGVHETTAGRVMIKAKREGMGAFNND